MFTSSGNSIIIFLRFSFLIVYFISARLVTVWIESQDINLYISFGLSVILNLGVVISALVFQPSKKPEKPE